MELTVLTQEKEIFQGNINSVKVPGANGQFEVLKGHAPIVSSLVTGPVRILSTNGDKKVFNIAKGFIEVIRNEVSLLVQGVDEETNN